MNLLHSNSPQLLPLSIIIAFVICAVAAPAKRIAVKIKLITIITFQV